MDFQFTATPNIIFGSGKINMLPKLIETYGNSVLLVTGRSSFTESNHWDTLLLRFESAKIHWTHEIIDREPTPDMIDNCVSKARHVQVDVVIAIGGGSVVDAGKAISAMLCQDGSVKDYLEGVGTKVPQGKKVPFIAVPTTAGTGSETTKNAVISQVGAGGFKKSLRHDRYVPNVALIDPQLAIACPKNITAQSGMDAFTQLLESYTSTHASALTDALAVDGLRHIRDSLYSAVEDGGNLPARAGMAYAAMVSGITLANAGLGTIHGFASAVGGYVDVPHGLVCAVMMEPVNRITIDKLRKKDAGNHGLAKFARAGKIFSKDKNKNDAYYIDVLLDTIANMTHTFEIRKLSVFGMKKSDFDKIIKKTGNKYNPAPLGEEEMYAALEASL